MVLLLAYRRIRAEEPDIQAAVCGTSWRAGIKTSPGGSSIDDDLLALRTEHAFDIRINFDRRWKFGPVSGGAMQHYTSVGAGSIVSGPRLSGRLVDYSGADWPTVRSGRCRRAQRALHDRGGRRALIYIRNLGYVHPAMHAPRAGSARGTGAAILFSLHALFPGARRARTTGSTARSWSGSESGCRSRLPDDPPDHSLFRYYAVL